MFEIRNYHFYNENGCQPFAMYHSLLPNVLLFLAFHALPKIQYTVFKHFMRGKRESKDIQSTTTTNSRTLWHCRERTLFPQHSLLKKMLCHTLFFVICNSICTKQQTSYELVYIQNNFHLSKEFFLLIFQINKGLYAQ